MYDYATSKGLSSPKSGEHTTTLFIGKFTGVGIDPMRNKMDRTRRPICLVICML